MIQNLLLFFEISFRACNFFILVHTFQWTSSKFFFNFRFSSRKSQSQHKLAKKISYFTTKFRSFILLTSTSASVTLKIIYSCNNAKNLFHFTNFLAKTFLFGVRKNIWKNGAVPFLDAQELSFLEAL